MKHCYFLRRNNYTTETGKLLIASNFVSWNLLVGNMFYEEVNRINPFTI